MPIAKKTKPAPAKRYIESSALVAALLEDDAAAQTSIHAKGQRVMSNLTLTETTRAVLRATAGGSYHGTTRTVRLAQAAAVGNSLLRDRPD